MVVAAAVMVVVVVAAVVVVAGQLWCLNDGSGDSGCGRVGGGDGRGSSGVSREFAVISGIVMAVMVVIVAMLLFE
eukprot:5183513-Pleurochrysis_carterae.AAC.2